MIPSSSNLLIPVKLADGLTVETVYYGSGTLCLSTQAGCALRCPFCASGSRGLLRNLSLDELLLQVDNARAQGVIPRRVTLSGIGEPLHNPEAVRAFLAWSRQCALPVSLTTTGGPLERLEDILDGPHNGIMISLHAGTAAVHRRLVPGGPDYDRLWELLWRYRTNLSRRRGRKIGINYLLLSGVNDTGDELEALTTRMRSFPEATVHLLTVNPVLGSGFSSPCEKGFAEAHRRLRDGGIHVRRANAWRRESRGGCGTLMVDRLSSPPPSLLC